MAPFLDACLDGRPPIDRDPAFADVRDLPELAAVRAAGLECHEQFKAFVASSGGIPSS